MKFLGHDTGAIASYSNEICRDKDVLSLREKVKVSEDERLSETQCEVSLKMQGGGLRRLRHDLMEPMTLEVRAEKLGIKAVSLIGDPHADALWELSLIHI